jgi:hypothetical protein
VLYAIPVAFAVWSNLPTEQQINADAAWGALSALQQHDEKYKNLSVQALRRRLYRGLSDEQVTVRIREFATTEEQRVNAQTSRLSLGGDAAVVGLYTRSPGAAEERMAGAADAGPVAIRPQLAIQMDDLEKKRAQRMAAVKTEQFKAIAWGIAAWVLPVLALYFLAPRFIRPRTRSRMHRF